MNNVDFVTRDVTINGRMFRRVEIQCWAIINLTNQRQFAKTIADVTGRAVRQCGLFAARFFSRRRFSRLSSLTMASFGTVSTLRNAMSKRSAGVPPSGRSAGGGNRIRLHDNAVSDGNKEKTRPAPWGEMNRVRQ